ncbi:MAG TPA: alanine racemase, partial [Aquaticitalea sp.]|nr:alanine racemase [Aquaticitalea sp.]
RTISCLLQIKIAEEDSKFGMSPDEASQILQSKEFSELKNVRITGLMGMATFTDNEKQIQKEFSLLKGTFETLKKIEAYNFKPEIISMGMSDDYQLAIDCGSTMIRVGSRIFGSRNY